MMLAMLGLVLSMAAPLRAENLDGTKWKVSAKAGFKGFAQKCYMWPRQTMTFDAGQVSKGKTKTAYSTSQDNGKMTWKADTTTAKGSKISWTGTVDGNKMTGTSTMTDAKGKTKTHEWKACKCMPKKK
jgi:hypothetical protein